MRCLLKIGLHVIFCFIQYGTYAQDSTNWDSKIASWSGGCYFKCIRLIDADTKKPIPNYFFHLVHLPHNTPGDRDKTNAEGYGILAIKMRQYTKSVEINLNDGSDFNPAWIEWKDRINTIPYKPVNKEFTWPSKPEIRDTVIVEMKRLPDGTPTLINKHYDH